ncbi:MAG: putative quinol monooxygenase [Pseudomonadota bacterium]
MIIVHGMIPVKPERRELALELARRMGVATRKEPGCISYDFYVGLSDPNTLLLFQEWQDMESLSAHFQTEHMDEFMQQLPDCLNGQITTRRFAVAQELDDDSDDDGDGMGDDLDATPPVIH